MLKVELHNSFHSELTDKNPQQKKKVIQWCSVQFGSVPWLTVSLWGHEGQFSWDPLSVFFAYFVLFHPLKSILLISCVFRIFFQNNSSQLRFRFFFSFFTFILSSFSGTAVLMSRSSAASGMWASSSGCGLFRISLKCSVQCSSCSLCYQRGPLLFFVDGVGMILVLSTDELCYSVHSPLLVTFHCILCLSLQDHQCMLACPL